ncbi:MAG: leucyl aminopeptidase [Patescibacteria group bacterium]|nr:leucyl aminopeptidase [Patescibacteria group bacterium]
MRFSFTSDQPINVRTDTLVINIFEGEKIAEGLVALDQAMSGAINEAILSREITGKLNEYLLLPTFGKIPAKKVLLIGSGKKSEYCSDQLRMMSGTVARVAQKKNLKTIAFQISDQINPFEKSQVVTEGVVLALFDPKTHRTKEKEEREIEELMIILPGVEDAAKVDQAINTGRIIAESTNWARFLTNEPANFTTPTRIVREAKELAEKYGFEIEVIDEKEALKKGMDAFAGIAKGSDEPSYMVVLKYLSSEKGQTTLGLVGKGLTFDSGGISIKPDEKMGEMKYDMAGAAAVLGIFKAVGELKPKINLIGVTPLTENLPSGKAVKPGDVLTAMNGKTIEISSTDAEGRVVLADALIYAQKLGAEKIVDLATLTGAITVALGRDFTGVFGRPQAWVDQFMSCAKMTSEKIWQLPLPLEYRKLIKSDIADVDNIGARGTGAGAIKGALFLEEFVDEDKDWVHLDIAGTAWMDNDSSFLEKGPTGVGIRTIIRLISEMEKQQS